MPSGIQRNAAIGLTALLAVVIVLLAATSGLGKPGLPDNSVAFVDEAPGGEVTSEEVDVAVEQVAASQETPQEPPPPGTPQYDQLQESAMSRLLFERWFNGEAEERGIEVTEREVEQELETIIRDQLGGQKAFERTIKQLKLSEEDAQNQIRMQIVQERVQEDVLGGVGEPSDQEVTTFYDENIEQFETPETRDVRTLLNPKEGKAQEAFDQLSKDDSPASWKRVTKKLSTDEATASLGGLRQGVAQGQNEPALDEAIFSAPEGELAGPIETDGGFYVIQVEGTTPASTPELDEQTRTQIQQTLQSQQQQEFLSQFQEGFIAKWRARTVCADDYMTESCGNAPPPEDACQGDDEGEEQGTDPTTGEPIEGCPAPVPSTQPVPPSSAGDANATGLPQGPQTVPAAGGLEGALPLGTPGAPGAPPGAAPPGAPQGAPQGAPAPAAP